MLDHAFKQRMAEQDEKTAAFKKAVRDVGEFVYDLVVPQTLSDVALEAAFVPAKLIKGGLKAVSKRVDLDKYRQAAVGTAGVTYTPETEGAVLEKLLRAGADTMKSTALAQPASKQEFLKLAGKTHTDLARALERKAKDPRYSMLMRDLLEKYEVFDPQKAKEVYDSGRVFVGSRGVTFGDIDARSAKNTTPGIHFAPAGQERQVADILAYKQSIDAGKPDYDPKVGLVAARIKNPILVSDREAELPAELAAKLELVPEFREMVASGLPESEAITVLARRNGVGPLIYGNKIEGVKGRVNPSISIIDPDDIQKFSAGGLYRMAKKYFDPDKKPKQLQGTQIVKERGGNWLAGSVEDALKTLIPKAGAMNRSAVSVMDEMNQTYPAESLALMSPETRTQFDRAFNMLRPKVALQKWIEGPLTKYVKRDMATEGDPVRRLAEEGVLHVDHGALRQMSAHTGGAWTPEEWLEESRYWSPHSKILGNSPAARAWEDAADSQLDVKKAEHIDELSGFDYEAHPWAKPETLIVDWPQWTNNPERWVADDLGFSHLIDELSNALNPNSGLPAHLQLTPEAVKNMSMEKAVRRVADINAWRAAQKIAADQARAQNAATVLHKEYPDKGFKWVELRQPENLPEGWKEANQSKKTGRANMWYDEKNVIQNKHPGEQALEDALKYEGDVMGHCVGGYCEDVLEGRSRIFSLRDAKGQPHVTIEVKPQKSYGTEHLEKFREQAQKDALASGVNPGTPDDPSAAFLGAVNRRMEELAKENLPLRIQQIKGKQNRAPNPEYLPFVQDFVRSQPWSDVGDLANAGLTRHPTGKYITDAEANALAAKHFGDVKIGNKPDDIENPWQYANRIRRYDPDMLSDTDKAFLVDWDAGNFASGGIVDSGNMNYNPERIDALVAQLRNELYA